MPVVVSVIVGTILLGWLLLFTWSSVRAAAVRAHRDLRREPASLPNGFVPATKEPDALRAPFAFALRAQVRDVVPACTGSRNGHVLTICDVLARHAAGAELAAHTVVTADVEHLWPWLRLRSADVEVAEVTQPMIEVPGTAGSRWACESADGEFAHEVLRRGVLALLDQAPYSLQLELTPRHLLLAAPGRARAGELVDLVELAAAVLDRLD